MKIHYKCQHLGPPIKCPHLDCGEEFKTETALKQHMRVVHRVKCTRPECGEEFETETAFKQHMKEKHYVKCVHPECSREFESDSNRRRHFRNKHTGEPQTRYHTKVKCSFPACEREFRHEADQQDHHQATHLGALNQHLCEHHGCDYPTWSGRNLKDHYRNLHGKKSTFQCNDCTFKSNSKSGFLVHRFMVYDHRHLLILPPKPGTNHGELKYWLQRQKGGSHEEAQKDQSLPSSDTLPKLQEFEETETNEKGLGLTVRDNNDLIGKRAALS